METQPRRVGRPLPTEEAEIAMFIGEHYLIWQLALTIVSLRTIAIRLGARLIPNGTRNPSPHRTDTEIALGELVPRPAFKSSSHVPSNSMPRLWLSFTRLNRDGLSIIHWLCHVEQFSLPLCLDRESCLSAK
jgi:hypothetical protein